MTQTEILITREIAALGFLAFGTTAGMIDDPDDFDGFAAANAVTEADDAAINAYYAPIDTAVALMTGTNSDDDDALSLEWDQHVNA